MDDLYWNFEKGSFDFKSSLDGFANYAPVGAISVGGSRYLEMNRGDEAKNVRANYLELQGSRVADQYSPALFGAFCSGDSLGKLIIVRLMNVKDKLDVWEKFEFADVKFTAYNKMMSAQGGQDTFTIAYTKLVYTYQNQSKDNVVTKFGGKGYSLVDGKCISAL